MDSFHLRLYIDDVLVPSRDQIEYVFHLHQVFECHKANSLIIRPDKCHFGLKTISFHRHKVSAGGVCPLPAEVQAVKQFPLPVTSHSLSQFWGFINYCHGFIQHAASILHPFHALVDHKHPSLVLHWSDSATASFQAAKDALATATLLSHADPHLPLALHSDASIVGVGAILEQFSKGKWHLLGLFSRTITPTEQRYSVFNWELLATLSATRHFQLNSKTL